MAREAAPASRSRRDLTAVDSTNVDDDPWLDSAMDHIYFMSARTLDGEMYFATR